MASLANHPERFALNYELHARALEALHIPERQHPAYPPRRAARGGVNVTKPHTPPLHPGEIP
jgi:hypothetical protein